MAVSLQELQWNFYFYFADIQLQYQAPPIIFSYIDNIVPGSREVEVDHLWTNLLAYYFPITQDYGVEREAYVRSRSETRANVCVSTMTHRDMHKVVMVENKRATRSQTAHPPGRSWAHARGQLLAYMLSHRANQLPGLPSLFGIVGIGRWVRFYRLRRGANDLEDFQQNMAYNLVDNSFAIEQIILSIRADIARHR